MTKPKCEDCRFFEANLQVAQGECRRLSPRREYYNGDFRDGHKTTWPLVHETDWCGEFKEKEGE